MNISEEEYNRVIGGLRTQLELHQRKQNELLGRVSTQSELIARLSEDLDKRNDAFNVLVPTCSCGMKLKRVHGRWEHTDSHGVTVDHDHKPVLK